MIRSFAVSPSSSLLWLGLAVLTIAPALGGAQSSDSPGDRPNVILVITDDQGYGDLSCHGNPVLETPHLDALAAESVRLEDFHVAPTCSPTRAALLTGHWTNRTGVWHTIMGRSLLREDEVTLGTLFANAGYATGMFGKWHLGDNHPFRPEDRGFEEVFRHGGGGVGQTPDYWNNAYFDDTYFHNSEPVPVEGFCTDVFFRRARAFMKEQVEADRPFLAYISTNAAHGPFHAPPESTKPYEEQFGTRVANFFGMIANIDHNVGALREWLAEEGLAEDTLFIFTTDNGTAAGGGVHNAGMRGTKGSHYDGGHRVPFFLHWPGGDFDEKKQVEPLTGHVDVVPTLIDLCGIQAPSEVQFDGTSLRPLLEGDDPAAKWNERILVTDSQRLKDPLKWRKSSVMTSEWRLVSNAGRHEKPSHQLYAIDEDPGQENDVIDEHPDVAKRLKDFYHDWWAELEPGFGEPARIELGTPVENPSRLTCHDWITDGLTPWNQGHIRAGDSKPSHTGFWNVEVTEAGDYEIALRRWPREGEVADEAITASIPAGEDVPGARAYRARPGVSVPAETARIEIAGQTMEVEVPEGAAEVTFDLTLEKGPTRFSAVFEGPDGTVTGAYYAYVKRQ